MSSDHPSNRPDLSQDAVHPTQLQQTPLDQERHQLEEELRQTKAELNYYRLLCEDITAHQQIEKTLQEERNFVSAVLETVGTLVVVLDTQGRIVRFNRACEQTTDYTFDEVKGKPFWDLFVIPEEIAGVKAVFAQLQAGQFPNQHENYWLTREGKHRLIAWSNTALLNPQGAVEYIIGTGIDITERRQAEEALRRSQQQQYQVLVDSIGGIVWELDLQAVRFMFVSQKAEQLLGYPVERWLNEPSFWQNHVHPDDREWVITACNSATQDQQDHELEYRMIAANGSIVWVHDIITVVVENNQAVKLRGVIVDITERKRTEQVNALLATAIENAGDAIEISDDQSRLEYVNPAFERITGYTRAETIGQTPAALLRSGQHNDAFYQKIWETISQGHVWRGCLVSKRKDGSLCHQEATVSPVRDAAGAIAHYVAVKRDITERKQAEIALQQQTERERLIAAIAQRIRQSLNLQEILNTAVAEVRTFLQVERVVIYQIHSDHSSFVVESVAPGCSSVLNIPLRDPCFDAEYTCSYQQGRVSAIDDIHQANLHPCYTQLLEQLELRALLLVPIVFNGQVWGLLCAHHCSEPRHWRSFEVELLQQLSTQVAIAIQQSALFEQVQLLNANLECQVQDRTEQLQRALRFEALLKRITDKVRDSLDENQILQTIVQELAEGLNVGSCEAALYDLEQKTATICYTYTTSMPVAAGQVLQMSDFPGIYPQLLQGQHFQFCKFHSTRGWATVFACPIFDDQGVLGDLWLFAQQEHTFEELEIRLVQQLANQCAIALRQARLYQSAQAQVKELEKLNSLKDDFLSTVSHELRTPVANIKMATQMLDVTLNQLIGVASEAEPNLKRNKISRYLQILNDECEREISLINDLLDLQRLDAGLQPLTLSTIDLQPWLSQVIEPFRTIAHGYQQTLQVNLPGDLPSLLSDATSLERILIELLNNACKYTPPGESITVTVDVCPATPELPTDKLQLRVSNSGVEIPTDQLSFIFEKFYRVPSADPWKRGGTGLGLALVKKLINHLGGFIEVESTSAQTSFTVSLPLNQGNLEQGAENLDQLG